MKTLLKWLTIIFVLIPLALFVLAWGLFELTPQEKMRAMAAKEIGHRINRQVTIGPIHLSWSGLRIDDLKLSETPTFKQGTLLSAKGVQLGWNLASLWQGLDLKKKMITRSSGHFEIEEFNHPHYGAKDLSIRWSLTDIDATGAHLNGWATLEQGMGLLQNVDQLMATSPSAKIALTPLLAIMNLDRLGVVKLGLPDLRHWPIQGIHGKYSFKNGTMSIERFVIESHELTMGTTGTVQLASGALLLDAQLNAPRSALSGAMDATLRISGTTSHPKVDLSTLKKKAFKATVNRILEDPGTKKNINKVLNNLFH